MGFALRDKIAAMVRRRRLVSAIVILLLVLAYSVHSEISFQDDTADTLGPKKVASVSDERLASYALAQLAIKGRAPKDGYSRELFGGDWAQIKGCDLRNLILQRDLSGEKLDEDGCLVLSGRLEGPYTKKTISFKRGVGTSNKVQIDHVVALSDAWQKGAQELSTTKRDKLANDPLNLLAVDGEANSEKSDSDAASWLPPDKIYHCRYIARQIAVKLKYHLWVSSSEKTAMQRVLQRCPTQQLPKVES